VFPFVPTLAAAGGAAFRSTIGTAEPVDLARLALGGGPGTWVAAWFLPIGAALALAVVRAPFRTAAWRAALLAAVGLGLSWASAAGWLPDAVSNAPAYATLAAVAQALLLAYGLSSALGLSVGRPSACVRSSPRSWPPCSSPASRSNRSRR